MSVDGGTAERGRSAADTRHGPRADNLGRERWELLHQIDALLDGPMILLSFAWLGLMIVDFLNGLGPTLSAVSAIIWALFGLQFAIGFVVAPSKTKYVRRNWLTALALVLPAFRLLRVVRAFRLLRAARAARSVSLLRLFTTLNRGMRAVNRVLGSRGVGYVVLLTIMVTFGGAAGMAQFENPAAIGQPGTGLDGYGEALWWTAMTMTTMGSDYFPRTLEGRILGWLLALYAFTVFGYITATIASLFLARDAATTGEADATEGAAEGRQPEVTGELAALQQEVAALRAQVRSLADALAPDPAGEAGTPPARGSRPTPAATPGPASESRTATHHPAGSPPRVVVE
jgi:voltage-gated potassium channel